MDFIRKSRNSNEAALMADDDCDAISCAIDYFSPDGSYPCVKCPTGTYTKYIGQIGKCTAKSEIEIVRRIHDAMGPIVGWDVDSNDFCHFTGIVCDSENHITKLHLKGMGLTGQISGSLGFLDYLNTLDLSDNMLSGHIPSDLRFAPLENLDITGNNLHGIIPPTLCLKPDINGNGEDGVFNCEVIACPIGYYSTSGKMDIKSGERCTRCPGGEKLGSKKCHNARSKGHPASVSKEVSPTGPKKHATFNDVKGDEGVGLILFLVILVAVTFYGVVKVYNKRIDYQKAERNDHDMSIDPDDMAFA